MQFFSILEKQILRRTVCCKNNTQQEREKNPEKAVKAGAFPASPAFPYWMARVYLNFFVSHFFCHLF